MRLQELGGGRRFAVELADVAVPLRVVVVGVDHDLAGERPGRNLAVVPQGDGHHDDVAGSGGLLRGRRPGLGPELLDERGEGLRPARVADHHLVAAPDREPRDLASDVPRTDEPDGRHGL